MPRSVRGQQHGWVSRVGGGVGGAAAGTAASRAHRWGRRRAHPRRASPVRRRARARRGPVSGDVVRSLYLLVSEITGDSSLRTVRQCSSRGHREQRVETKMLSQCQPECRRGRAAMNGVQALCPTCGDIGLRPIGEPPARHPTQRRGNTAKRAVTARTATQEGAKRQVKRHVINLAQTDWTTSVVFERILATVTRHSVTVSSLRPYRLAPRRRCRTSRLSGRRYG